MLIVLVLFGLVDQSHLKVISLLQLSFSCTAAMERPNSFFLGSCSPPPTPALTGAASWSGWQWEALLLPGAATLTLPNVPRGHRQLVRGGTSPTWQGHPCHRHLRVPASSVPTICRCPPVPSPPPPSAGAHPRLTRHQSAMPGVRHQWFPHALT